MFIVMIFKFLVTVLNCAPGRPRMPAAESLPSACRLLRLLTASDTGSLNSMSGLLAILTANSAALAYVR